MQTINKVILLVLALAGLYYWWSRQQTTVEYDRQVGALASAMDRRFVLPETPPAEAEAMFLRAMVIFADYRTLLTRGRIRIGEETYLKDVLKAAGYTSDREIELIAKSLQANLSLCHQMRILPEEEGTKAFLNNQPALIRAGSFKGDTLTIGRRLSAAMAPELANHPANYAFIPASAASLVWPFTLTDSTLAAAEQFKSQGLLDPAIVVDLKHRVDQLKAVNP